MQAIYEQQQEIRQLMIQNTAMLGVLKSYCEDETCGAEITEIISGMEVLLGLQYKLSRLMNII